MRKYWRFFNRAVNFYWQEESSSKKNGGPAKKNMLTNQAPVSFGRKRRNEEAKTGRKEERKKGINEESKKGRKEIGL